MLSAHDLKALQRAWIGRERVTDRLIEAVKNLEKVIVKNGTVGDKVVLGDYELTIESQGHQFVDNFLIMRHKDFTGPGSFVIYPLHSGYLYSDLNSPYEGISKEELLWFAEQSGEIVRAFAELHEERVEEMEELLQKIPAV